MFKQTIKFTRLISLALAALLAAVAGTDVVLEAR